MQVYYGITYSTYLKVKNGETRTQILKEEITEDRKQEIRNEVKKEGYANKIVEYKEFQNLYVIYEGEMLERDFANILGISYSNYMNMKNKGTRAKIKLKGEELERVKYQICNQNREYTIAELETLCTKYNITMYDLLDSIYSDTDYVDELMTRESIYIGKCEIPEEFREKYAKNLLEAAQLLSGSLTKRYRITRFREDFASDVLMYMMQNKGDLVLNSNNDENALEIIRKYMYRSLEYKCISNLKVKKEISLDRSINSERDEKRFTGIRTVYQIVKAPDADVEEKIEKEEDKDEENGIAKKMKECYLRGMSNKQAIKLLTEEYNISQEELLKALEIELAKKRRIRKTDDGSVYLGEELE